MRNDERLRTIYEVMAPYIVRSERNWRDYLAFASRFHKQSFDNILLVYAQDEDVTILATKKQWAGVGRNLISRPKGIAVCVYSNARLTLDYLFDISVTAFSAVHCIEDPSVIVFIQHCKCKTQFSAHFVKSIVFDNSDLLIMCFHFFRNFFYFFFICSHKFCDFIQFIKFAENTFFKIFSVFSTHKCYITFL